MSKTLKKLLFVVVMAMLCVCVAVSASAAETETVDGVNFHYTVENGEATLVYDGNQYYYTDTMVVPETLGGYPVTAIGDKAFYGNVKSVTIPASVKTISEKAFEDSYNLTEIKVKSGNANYSSDMYGVLFNKDKTTLIRYPNKNKRTSYSVPYSVKTIGKEAFRSSYDLENITLIAVETISESAFRYCGIKEISIPDTVTTIGASAFDSCSELQKVTLPSNLTAINDSVFNYCALKEIEIPASVTYIGDYAFQSCDFGSIVIPEAVTTIGDFAFRWCSELTEITIPKNVTSIGEGTFDRCEKLEKINVHKSNPNYSDEDGVLFNKDKTELIGYSNGNSRTTYTIPQSVTAIAKNAFSYCKLQKLVMSDNVKTIGDYAFSSCTNLEEIVFSKSLTTIGNGAFSYCIKLEEVTFPASLTTIGEKIFNCYDQYDYLSEIYGSIKAINVDSNNPNFSSVDGVLFNKNKTEIVLYPQGKTNSTYTIPSTVKTVGKQAFFRAYYLEKVTLPYSVNTIKEYAFDECKYLEEMFIPGSVATIGDWAFYGCSRLADVTIENGVKTIGEGAFRSLGFMYDIIVPESVTSVADNAFYDTTTICCYDNTYIASYVKEKDRNHFIIDETEGETVSRNLGDYRWTLNKTTGLLEFTGSGTIDDCLWHEYKCWIKAIKINGNFDGIREYAFGKHSKVKSVIFTGSVPAISEGLFADCISLKEIVLPEGVKRIENNAFGTSGLRSITIPASLEYVAYDAFDSCEMLKSVHIKDLAAYCALDFGYRVGENPFFVANYDYFNPTTLYYNNEPIVDLVIPEGVEKIGRCTFAFYQALRSVTIPESVSEIGEYAFALCYKLEKITVDENNQHYSSDSRGVLFDKDKTRLIQFPVKNYTEAIVFDEKGEELSGDALKELVKDLATNTEKYRYDIPDTVKVIEPCAFYQAYFLSDVTIPDGVTYIGEGALGYSFSVLSVRLPGTIEMAYLDECRSLEICEGVTELNYISDGYNLRSLMLPSTLTKIDTYFLEEIAYSDEQAEIFYAGTQEQWNNIEGVSDLQLSEGQSLNIRFNHYCEEHNFTSKLFDDIGGIHLDQYFWGGKKYTCQNCGWFYFKIVGEEHNISDWTVKTPANCDKPGVEERVCYDCEYTETRAISLENGHAYEKVVTAPTCTTKGYTTYTCSCGDSYVDNYVDTIAHSYTSKVTTAATHLKEGVMTYTCKCGDSYTEAIAKTTKHTYSSVVVAPTCTSQGYTTYICACGHTYEADYVPSVAHNDDNNDGTCDACGTRLIEENPSKNCSCNCHKSGIMGIIWKILRIFYKLVGSKKFCACGVAHY